MAASLRTLLFSLFSVSLLQLTVSSQRAPVRSNQDQEFPSKVGTYWIYHGTVKWQAGNSIDETVVDWKMEVVRSLRVGPYEIVVLKGHPDDLIWYEPGKARGDYLIVRDSDTYYLVEPQSSQNMAEILSNETKLKERLNLDSSFLQVPLREGMCIGRDPSEQREDTMFCWAVHKPASIRPNKIKGVPSNQTFTEFTLVYYANTDHTWFTFVPGIGITSFIFGHHGTVSEANVKLVEFHQGK